MVRIYSIEAETKKFYKEFLHYDLSDKEVGYILNGLDPEGKEKFIASIVTMLELLGYFYNF